MQPEARYVLAYGYDFGWTTNVPVDEFLSADALVAIRHDGEPIAVEHGGPARLIVPRLYAWKSANGSAVCSSWTAMSRVSGSATGTI